MIARIFIFDLKSRMIGALHKFVVHCKAEINRI